ncbi:bifunctional [glutamine synthetase] adenylyltransferase/[glutamine synthetase]-adenylyl-L-tyrosine phosphorylase [Salininema proteolyticum]|uniref:Bifunctional [glutamine synthetase] adenylyltransferase/[glutamine synthetase]-adenylyl-L-tyrosine phosphorylase n=1 Tax=Salininema proteolyticum TaxID=1607685 RepID=A0ABV8TV31_9ACTN
MDDLSALAAVSDSLSDFFTHHPEHVPALEGDTLGLLDGATPGDLPTAWRINLARIAIDDYRGRADLPATMRSLSTLADTILRRTYEIAEAEYPGDAGLAIVAMGKTGARELNYISDVDIVFIGSGDLDIATRRAEYVCRTMSEYTWQADPNLRPEGRNGPLVRSLDSYLAYLRDWARTWEFQALIKARPVAGDLDLARRWQAQVAPMAWEAIDRPSLVDDIRDMRSRVEKSIPHAKRKWEIKLGPGGLRDIEFAVQLLQLVHGRADEDLRVKSTFDALDALVSGGYLARQDGADLREAYAFLRTVEHRLQLRRLHRTHQLPRPGPALTHLRQSLGHIADEDFLAVWRTHAATARRLHEKLLYKPLLDAVASIPTETLRLSESAATTRLSALGFSDPATALTHIRRLTAGVSRTATLQKNLLPVVLDELADSPEPDRGLLAYRQVSESLGSTPWYLRFLRDAAPAGGGPNSVPPAVTRLARLLGTSRYFTNLLQRSPQALRYLADDADLEPRTLKELATGMRKAAARHTDPGVAMGAVRAIRRQELLRISAADLLGLVDLRAVARALSDLTDAVLTTALAVATRAENTPLAIIAMGRYGGQETAYGSDADIVVVHDGDPAVAARAVSLMRDLLNAPANEPPVTLDFGLRPEGKGGPLVPSFTAYRRYYSTRSLLWERQALLRARVVHADFDIEPYLDSVRYAAPITHTDLVDFRRLKARVDTERLPRNADRTTHTKLGRGGLVDIEWAVQLLQLEHPSLQSTSTITTLDSALSAGYLAPETHGHLRDAWLLVSRVRNAMTLTQGVPRDQIPTGPALGALAAFLGYESDTEAFLNDYRFLTRHAHNASEEVITQDPQ